MPTIRFAGRDRSIGGLNTIVYNLIQSISELPNVEASFVCRKSSEEIFAEGLAREQIITIKSGPNRVLNKDEQLLHLVDYGLKVKKLFDHNQPDIVHTSGSEAGAVMSMLRNQGLNTPWVHTNYATIGVRKVLVEKADFLSLVDTSEVVKRELNCLLDCDHIISLSEIDAQEIAKIFRIAKKKISYIYPGIDRQIFYPNRSIVRDDLIISAGRLSPIKDYAFLLTTFRLLLDLCKEGLKPKLLVVGGNNKEREELGLEQLADKLKIAKQLIFSDALSQIELAECFRQAKVFIGHSQHETFGLLPAEARACGLPTIVRNNSSYKINIPAKFISPNHSEADMAIKIKEILCASPEKWFSLSRESIDSVAVYNWTKAAREHYSVYERVIKRKLQ
ncbi:MAG TPA: glycosyltransferase [bacterium]|nr:glycosyltransferase [bacterium]